MNLFFNSIPFFIFFLCACIAYYSCSAKHRWSVLLLSSLAYYSLLDINGVIILTISTTVDYFISIKLSSSDRKKTLVVCSVLMNISVLFIYKYFNMFADVFSFFQTTATQTWSSPTKNLIAPLGISFFTFKKISYIVDVAKGVISAEKHYGRFLLYVTFFLQIVAGPIERAKTFLPQIKKTITYEYSNVIVGFFLMLCGLAMKVVIADRIALYTNVVFENVFQYQGPTFALAAYVYSIQLYTDFAGYSLVAIGCGRMLGLNIPINFNLPYFSTSISEFWRRWHITLSLCFRDYLYIPLGGNRVPLAVQCRNIMIVFLLCGLWHGANWTFVLWGGLHGAYLTAERVLGLLAKRYNSLDRFSSTIPTWLKIFCTFHLVTFAWIFFRANNVHDALYFVSHLFQGWPKLFIDTNVFGYSSIGICIFLIFEYLQFKSGLSIKKAMSLSWPIRWAVMYFLIFSIILCGVDADNSFIYVQF